MEGKIHTASKTPKAHSPDGWGYSLASLRRLKDPLQRPCCSGYIHVASISSLHAVYELASLSIRRVKQERGRTLSSSQEAQSVVL